MGQSERQPTWGNVSEVPNKKKGTSTEPGGIVKDKRKEIVI